MSVRRMVDVELLRSSMKAIMAAVDKLHNASRRVENSGPQCATGPWETGAPPEHSALLLCQYDASFSVLYSNGEKWINAPIRWAKINVALDNLKEE